METPEDALAVSYEALEDLLIKHPYMIGVRLLLLSKYQKDGSPRLNDYLKLCATYCPDRRVLFNWVNKFKQTSLSVASPEAESETALNNASLETSEAYQQVSNIIKFDPSNNSVGLGVLNLENEPINEVSPVPIVTLTPIESVDNQPTEVEALTQHLDEAPTKLTEFGVIEFVIEEHAPEDLALPELPQDEGKAEEVVKIELGEVIEVAEPEAEEEEKTTKAADSDSNVIFGNFEEDVFDAETFIPDFDNLLVTNTKEPLPDPDNAAVETEPLDTNLEYHEPIQPAVYVYEHPAEVANLRIDYFEADKDDDNEKEKEEEEEHEMLIQSLETTILTETNEVIEAPKEEEEKEEDKNTSPPLIALEVLSEEKEQEQNTMDDEHFIQPKNGNKLVVSEFSSWLRTLKSKKESADESAEQKIIRNFKTTNAETAPPPPKPTPPPAISQSNAIRNQIDKDENYMANNEDGDELFEQIEDLASKSIEDNNDIVSETLAQILTRQGKTDRALVMYKRLSVMFPDKKAYFSDIISKLSDQK